MNGPLPDDTDARLAARREQLAGARRGTPDGRRYPGDVPPVSPRTRRLVMALLVLFALVVITAGLTGPAHALLWTS